MGGFDIDSLLHFLPPRYFCENCYALYVNIPKDTKRNLVICDVCKVEYVPTETYPLWKAAEYFDANGLMVKYPDTILQGKVLALIARRMRTGTGRLYQKYLPMEGLLEALSASQQFVHFVTYGMSLQLVGALRMTALRVPVRGIVSNASPAIAEELKLYADESAKLTTRLYERSENPGDWGNMPHQKVIIVDGMLAFKGSANLTVDGWRKAAKGLDSVEVVTDVSEVITLNNKLFSPVWAAASQAKQIVMEDYVPF